MILQCLPYRESKLVVRRKTTGEYGYVLQEVGQMIRIKWSNGRITMETKNQVYEVVNKIVDDPYGSYNG